MAGENLSGFHMSNHAMERSQQRCIPPKYFYDHAGSRLFESICEHPEYYPTRTETALLTQYADEIAAVAAAVGASFGGSPSSCARAAPLGSPAWL